MTGVRLTNTSLFFISKPLLSRSQLSALCSQLSSGPFLSVHGDGFLCDEEEETSTTVQKAWHSGKLREHRNGQQAYFSSQGSDTEGEEVSFNPANEIFVFVATPNYLYSGPKKKRVQQRKSRVKQASKKKQVELAENARELKLSVTPVRLTRSSAHKMQEGNAEAVCLPLEVKFSEGVGGETVSSGGLIHRQLRSRMVLCKYGGDPMVSRKETNEDSFVARIGVEPEKIQEQFKANVTKVEGSSVLSEKLGEIDLGDRITKSQTRAEGIAYCWIR